MGGPKYKVDTVELKKAMLENGIDSNVELAEITKINRNTISDIVNGKSNPTLGVMYAIAEALNMPSEKAGKIFFAVSVA